MKKIAIVTTDKQLAELCELECKLLGYDPETFTSAQSLRKRFAKYLWDVDTVPDISKIPETNTVRMSRKEVLFEDEQSISLPPSLNKLRYLINTPTKNESSFVHDPPRVLILTDKNTRTVSFGERSIELSDHELKVIKYLCQNRGKPIKREDLNALLGAQRGNISDVYIYHLRKKLEFLCEKRMISTVRNQGYMIEIDLIEAE